MSFYKKLIGILFFGMLIMIGTSSVCSAIMFDGSWEANDNDFFAIELSFDNNPSNAFYLYDFDEGVSDSLLLFTDGVYNSTSVYFVLDSGAWYAGLSAGAKTLDLGSTRDFGFYFWDGTQAYTSYSLTTLDPGEAYRLADANTGMSVSVSDIAPVPLPGAALLMASGLVAFAAYRRKMR